MKRVVIGTAGHIDHGKSALVKALTGVDPDRLQEEKRRGITIELGFAHLDLGGGIRAGLVDVPGHERFVKTMAAGASGVDLALLVVAADEGVMPQTREHLDILRLLGVPRGLVVISKSDLAPELGEEWMRLLEADVAAACRGTFLEGAPLIRTSASTGEGLDALRQALAAAARDAPERPADGPTFLPVDRAFSLKGFGTVVTGTLLSGTIAEGDALALLPRGEPSLRVRSVQVHGAEVPRALAGQRTAVNLPGLAADEVDRGAVAVRAGELAPTSLIDVELELLAAAPRPLAHRARLLLHLGTAQVPIRVTLLGAPTLAPGARDFAQLGLDWPVAALPGQRFVLRGFAPIAGRGRTLAGGRVLAIHPRRRRRGRPESREGSDALAGADPLPRIAHLLREASFRGLTASDLFARTALPQRQLERCLETLGSRGEIVLFDRERRAYVAGPVLESLVRRARQALQESLAANPLATGLAREELRRRLAPELDARLFAKVLATLVERGEAVLAGESVQEKSRARPLSEDDARLTDALAQILGRAGLAPPAASELPKLLGVPEAKAAAVLRRLHAEGRAVRVSQGLYFDPEAVAALERKLVAFLRERERITTQQFKELVGATRKHAIPLAEYFDARKVTLRVGEYRVLLRPGTGGAAE